MWNVRDMTKIKIAMPNGYVSQNVTQKLVTAIPITFVNVIAIASQYSWAHDHLPSWHSIGQFIFAAGLESIAVYLSYMAYNAERKNDSAFKLKLSSYIYGAMIGIINYQHWALPNWHPTTLAIVVALASITSPILWSIYSRSISRSMLINRGLVEPHQIRIGSSRWFWHPINSWRVVRMATWTGQINVSKAIQEWEETRVISEDNIKDNKIKNISRKAVGLAREEIT